MASPIIAPPGPLNKDGKSITHFTSDQDVVWSTSGGTLANVLIRSVDWIAPNKTGLWTLSATNGVDAPTAVQITVRAILPNYWQWKTPINHTKPVLIWRPKFGPSQSRGFGSNVPVKDWELGDDDSSIENANEIQAFWDYHHPGRQFDMIDPVLEERRRYETDSDLAGPTYNHQDSYSWSFRIKEVYPFNAIT